MPENDKAHTSAGGMMRSMGRNAFGVLVSRVSGVVRDVVIAGYWGGSGAAQAAYHLAFKVPNMFRSLFGEGAFSSALVPSVSGKLELGDRESAWRIAERTISLQMLLMLALVLIGTLFSLVMLYVLPPDVRRHIRLTFGILPILLPYMLLVCATASFASILNAMRVFALPALNQAVFNVVQVAAILVIRLFWGNEDLPALLWFCGSVILAGVLQMGMLLIVCRRNGFVFHFRPIWKDEEVQGVCRRFVPSLVGAGTGLLNQCVDSILVASLGAVSVGALEYSHRLIYLPVGLLGVTMGNVCLTELSRCAASKDADAMAEKMDFSLRLVLFVSMPCAVLMLILAEPIAGLLFRHGNFSREALEHCVFALRFYLPALPAFCCQKVASTPHYANQDTRTPMRISLCCIGLNLVLNLILMQFLREGGLALATSICSWIQVVALLGIAWRVWVPQWRLGETLKGAAAMALASAVAGGCSLWVLRLLPAASPEAGLSVQKISRLIQVALSGGAGCVAYLLLSLLLRRPELLVFRDVVLRRRRRNAK